VVAATPFVEAGLQAGRAALKVGLCKSTRELEMPLEIFSTCPPSSGADHSSYLRHVVDVARWSERQGCKGILVYSDNSQLDAWLLSHVVLQHTAALCPLVAVQPIYMHPYTVAKTLASIGCLFGRQVYLNMVAGGFKNDLIALDDTTPHDRRYVRLEEYVRIIAQLLQGNTVTFNGEFYRVDKLKLSPSLAPHLFPGIFVSGSSDAGLAAARAISATAIKYPKPANEEEVASDVTDCGIRVGIIARQTEREAWDVAHARFPQDRRGQLTRQLATKVSDSVWHKQLSEPPAHEAEASPYWMVPFQNYKTMCPYLVGSYDRVGAELARYVAAGFRTVILDVPPSEEELAHTFAAFEAAMQPVR
jgi:alkanesulfonate monooxygenase